MKRKTKRKNLSWLSSLAGNAKSTKWKGLRHFHRSCPFYKWNDSVRSTEVSLQLPAKLVSDSNEYMHEHTREMSGMLTWNSQWNCPLETSEMQTLQLTWFCHLIPFNRLGISCFQRLGCWHVMRISFITSDLKCIISVEFISISTRGSAMTCIYRYRRMLIDPLPSVWPLTTGHNSCSWVSIKLNWLQF